MKISNFVFQCQVGMLNIPWIKCSEIVNICEFITEQNEQIKKLRLYIYN